MKRLMLAAAAASTMILAACGGGEVVVQAQLQGEGEQPVPLGGLPIQALRTQWGDVAFADADIALAERLKAARRPEAADTTDANGLARLTGLKSGQWWIHARYELPFAELYWNIPVTVEGDEVQVQLTRDTAEVRPKL